MSYHLTIGTNQGGLFPFALNTEADQIPLTRAELESLKFEIERVLLDTDQNYGPMPAYPITYEEMIHECTI